MSAGYIARNISTVGDLEQLAGVEDRVRFWKQFIPTFQNSGTEAGMKMFRKKCHALIRRRIKSGELSLCRGVSL